MNVVVTSLVNWRVCLRILIYQLLLWTSSGTSFKPVLYVIMYSTCTLSCTTSTCTLSCTMYYVFIMYVCKATDTTATSG